MQCKWNDRMRLVTTWSLLFKFTVADPRQCQPARSCDVGRDARWQGKARGGRRALPYPTPWLLPMALLVMA